MLNLDKILFIILNIFTTSALANIDGAEVILRNANQKVEKFLCGKIDCKQINPQIKFGHTFGYHGYYLKKENTILLSDKLDPINLQLTLLHEMIHAYRNRHSPNEELWVDEGIAAVFEFLYSGVWPQQATLKLQKSNAIFISNSQTHFMPKGHGYTSSFLFLFYLYKHFGREKFLSKILHSKASGWNNILTAIHELHDENIHAIPKKFLTQDSLIRHFAAALWFNDRYLASYGLFEIDQNYTTFKNNNVSPNDYYVSTDLSQNEFMIKFSNQKLDKKPYEIFSIFNNAKSKIKQTDENDTPEVYLSIFKN